MKKSLVITIIAGLGVIALTGCKPGMGASYTSDETYYVSKYTIGYNSAKYSIKTKDGLSLVDVGNSGDRSTILATSNDAGAIKFTGSISGSGSSRTFYISPDGTYFVGGLDSSLIGEAMRTKFWNMKSDEGITLGSSATLEKDGTISGDIPVAASSDSSSIKVHYTLNGRVKFPSNTWVEVLSMGTTRNGDSIRMLWSKMGGLPLEARLLGWNEDDEFLTMKGGGEYMVGDFSNRTYFRER